MADLSHLEKMGRELKCPICLSLLNSAASLGCNHVFCYACIEKSMKSNSNCPVCKVPYRRREVRPAPHMDNLVSIYKNMEVASGVNIFVTQNLSSTKLSEDGDKLDEGGCNGSKRLNEEKGEITAYKRRTLKKGSQKLQKSKRKISDSSPVKPSFPRKKRVQVPQCPLSETPTRPTKLVSSLNVVNDEEPRKNAIDLEDKGQPVLSPFFWLREGDDEDEKSNQHSDVDQPTDSMTTNGLSFSDIKDSLDESPSKPTVEEVCGKTSYDLDLFDSEMFEWTQRACSPELCSSPFKLQDEDIAGTEIKLLAAAPNEETSNQNPNGSCNQSGGILDVVVSDVPPLENNGTKSQHGSTKLTKRGRKKNETALKKCAKKSVESAVGNHSHLAKETKCLSQKEEHGVSDSFGSLKSGNKSKKKMNFGIDANKGTLQNVPADPINLGTPNGDLENFGTEISAFPEVEKVRQFTGKSRKSGRANKKAHFGSDVNKASPENVLADPISLGTPNGGRENFGTEASTFPEVEKVSQSQGKSRKNGKASKKVHFGIEANKAVVENVPADPISLGTPNNGLEKFGTEISAFTDVEKINQFPEKSPKNGGACRAQRVVDCCRKSKKQKLDSVDDKLLEKPSLNQNQPVDSAIPCLPTAVATSTGNKRAHEKQEKSSTVCLNSSDYDNIIQEKQVDAQANCGQLSENLQYSTDEKNLDSTAKRVCSQKHDRLDNKFHCAFCLSSKESEVSGRMVHYFNGKPIETDDTKNSKVIHAHWNCVEWAPNVYFDGDIAINLEAELSRSRRIKCNCCGNKGAALGCYEKSCRKSFHVSCAKLMPQCQWDTENFVMLCPLHPDSKLPSQGSGHQERKSSCTPKRQSNTKCIAVAREIGNNGRFTFRESSKKLVICCSALTMAEREAVAEFQRLSGVTVLQKWDDCVTHIIASTDENGACKRTLKILMGILKGKWVLGIEWIKACAQAMEHIEEERFEITLDVHGIRDGPQLGRLRVLNNEPKLFSGYKFFFTADFVPSYKGYLQQLVTAAGGTILLRKPVSSNQNIPCSSPNSQVFIIYSLELPDQSNPSEKTNIISCRRSDAELLAKSAAAKVATNLWLLNSIAGSKLASLVE